jgi:hypothetical protein
LCAGVCRVDPTGSEAIHIAKFPDHRDLSKFVGYKLFKNGVNINAAAFSIDHIDIPRTIPLADMPRLLNEFVRNCDCWHLIASLIKPAGMSSLSEAKKVNIIPAASPPPAVF